MYFGALPPPQPLMQVSLLTTDLPVSSQMSCMSFVVT